MLGAFYDAHSYPPPVDDLAAYKRSWNDNRRRAESCLLWPGRQFRGDRTFLVAGCGTVQAAHYAVRWPHARVVGIDVSAKSLAFEQSLKKRHKLENLELHELPLERASELRERFDHIVCTGVLHHLDDPDAGLRALRDVLTADGSINIMVYAPYGRAGIYMIQEYCRRLNVETTPEAIKDLAVTLQALPADHPLANLLRESPDFRTEAGLADALLHPKDRAYSVPQLFDFIENNGLVFGRWVRQAPYLAWCGLPASTPHALKIAQLPGREHYAAIELFRGSMVRHSFIAHQNDVYEFDFSGDAWRSYVPIRMAGTIEVQENLPDGVAAVLINRSHSFRDLFLPIDASERDLLRAVDGSRTAGEIARQETRQGLARAFLERLWRWDQVMFEVPEGKRPIL